MSLEIIKNDAEELSSKEKMVLDKITTLYKNIDYDVYLYSKFKIGTATPQILLIDAHRGIAIINVKDWNISKVEAVDEETLRVEGKEQENPVYKTESDADIIKGIIKNTQPKIKGLQNKFFSNIMLVTIKKKEIEENELRELFEHDSVHCFYMEAFNQLTLEHIFSDKTICLSNQDITQLRIAIFPELKISKSIKSTYTESTETAVALDKEQESFAKKMPYGHYMVTGVPGSGKTVILITRAIHLIKEHPEWNIAILTYNKSLEYKINEQIQLINEQFKKNEEFMGKIHIENIQVMTFHSKAWKLVPSARELQITMKKNGQSDEFWENTLPNLAFKNVKPMYDAVLIDEYQDFRDNWIQLCIKLCKKHLYTKGNVTLEGINLFLAGDRLQSIYNAKAQNWASLGISMRGRSKLLKTTYRTGKASSKLALKFLEQVPQLKEEVRNFYKEENENEVNIQVAGNEGEVQFKEGDIVNLLIQLLAQTDYKYEDILIIYPTDKIGDKILNSVPSDMRSNMRKVKEQENQVIPNKILMSTYHSSKGLEAKVVILVEVDHYKKESDRTTDILQRKLIYVGMTRASEKLIIHANDFSVPSLAKEIKDLIE